jgi:hypothetical protein
MIGHHIEKGRVLREIYDYYSELLSKQHDPAENVEIWPSRDCTTLRAIYTSKRWIKDTKSVYTTTLVFQLIWEKLRDRRIDGCRLRDR